MSGPRKSSSVGERKLDDLCLEERKTVIEPGFMSSSHFKRWLFPTVEAARERRWTVYHNRCSEVSLLAAASASSDSGWHCDVTESEYWRYVLHLQVTIASHCDRFGLDNDVKACAVMYLKRALSGHSLLDWSSADCLCACCLLVACKAEGTCIKVKDLSHLFGAATSQQIIGTELDLIEAIGFDLKVWHCGEPLRTLFNDFVAFARKRLKKMLGTAERRAALEKQRIGVAYVCRKVKETVKQQCDWLTLKCLISDAPMAFPPSQIALALLLLASSNVQIEKAPWLTPEIKQLCIEYFEGLFRKTPFFAALKQATNDIQKQIIQCYNQANDDGFETIVQKSHKKMLRQRKAAFELQQTQESATHVADTRTSRKRGLSDVRMTDDSAAHLS